VSMRIVDLANQQRGPACLAGDALVSYLYDECTFEERQRIEGHLASCGMCSAEVEALGATRVQISSWAPPDVALGFRISATTTAAADAAADTPVLPARMPWWRQPMPAWGQMVAATVIFGLGMAVGNRQLAGGTATNATAATVSLVNFCISLVTASVFNWVSASIQTTNSLSAFSIPTFSAEALPPFTLVYTFTLASLKASLTLV